MYIENKNDSIEYLKTLLKKGDIVFTRVDSVAPSGLSRNISLYCIQGNFENKLWRKSNKPRILNISFHVSKVLGYTFKPKINSVHVKGCGMDMCWHTVYELSYALFKKDLPLNQALQNQNI